jgi:hypothetical protein
VINRADAFAALDAAQRESCQNQIYNSLDKQARLVLDSVFAGRERLSIAEADIARLVMTLASTGLVAAITAARVSGDTEDDGEIDTTE